MKTLVIGAAIVDMVMRVEKLPERGGDIISDNNIFTVGGCAYNVANILKLLGVEYSLFIPLGEGTFASEIEKELIKNGHEIILRDRSADNGYCVVLVEKGGERTFITYRGIERSFKKEWFDCIEWSQYSNIYLEGYRMMGEGNTVIIEEIEKQKNKNIFFCPGPMINFIDKKLMKRIFKIKPILHLNDKEASDYCKTSDLEIAIKELHNKTMNDIYITLGENGVLYFDGKSIRKYSGEKNNNVIDTTGAGDSHVATIIAGISKNKSIDETIKIANIVASQVVSIEGPKIEKVIFSNEKKEV